MAGFARCPRDAPMPLPPAVRTGCRAGAVCGSLVPGPAWAPEGASESDDEDPELEVPVEETATRPKEGENKFPHPPLGLWWMR